MAWILRMIFRWRWVCYALSISLMLFLGSGAIRHRLFPERFPIWILGVEVSGETLGEEVVIRETLAYMAPPLRLSIAALRVVDHLDACVGADADDAGHCHENNVICVRRGCVVSWVLFHEAQHAFQLRLCGANAQRYANEWRRAAGNACGRPYYGVMTDYGGTSYEEDAADFCAACGDWLMNKDLPVMNFFVNQNDPAFCRKLEFQHRWGALTDAQFSTLSSLPLFQAK